MSLLTKEKDCIIQEFLKEIMSLNSQLEEDKKKIEQFSNELKAAHDLNLEKDNTLKEQEHQIDSLLTQLDSERQIINTDILIETIEKDKKIEELTQKLNTLDNDYKTIYELLNTNKSLYIKEFEEFTHRIKKLEEDRNIVYSKVIELDELVASLNNEKNELNVLITDNRRILAEKEAIILELNTKIHATEEIVNSMDDFITIDNIDNTNKEEN